MNIVFDIGGSKLRVASSRDGKTLGTPVITTSPKDPSVAIEKLVSITRDLTDGEKVTGIAGGIAGVLNPENTTLTAASNLPRWVGFNITEPLATEFQCPVKLINDAMLGALGEANFGAGQGFNSMLYYTIGTGVGGTWIINGHLPNSGTYEPGHQILDWQSMTTLEKLVDHAATPQEQVHYIAIGLLNSLLHWPADIIILGGGKTIHKTWTEKDVKTELVKISHAYVPIPDLMFAKLGDAAGLYGALHLAKQL